MSGQGALIHLFDSLSAIFEVIENHTIFAALLLRVLRQLVEPNACLVLVTIQDSSLVLRQQLSVLVH